jgi:hemerythrin-like domain-containing protein
MHEQVVKFIMKAANFHALIESQLVETCQLFLYRFRKILFTILTGLSCRGIFIEEIYMKPTDDLIQEHKIILHVMTAVERETDSIRATGKMDSVKIGKVIDFFQNFVDRCHHAKEEQYIITKMSEKGHEDDGFLASIILEHMEGRQFVQGMVEAFPAASSGDAIKTKIMAHFLVAYTMMLHGHIKKENTTLFPKADKLFTEQEQKEIAAGFEKIEREDLGPGAHEKYIKLAEELAKDPG